MTLANIPDADLLTDLLTELRRRGFTVTAVRIRPHRRAIFEERTGDDWHPTGAWRVATDDRSADDLCADWCDREHRPGTYRCAIYNGAELVTASEPRTLV